MSGSAAEGGHTAPARRLLPLRALAPAKINLGLFVGPTRTDGRHELASAMQSISLADELVLEAAGPRDEAPMGISEGRSGVRGVGEGRPGGRGVEVVCPGHPELAGPDNLAARALVRFCEQTGWEPGPLRLTIVKRVPVAAGMGGGSADAAAALRLAAYAVGRADAADCEDTAGRGDAGLLQRIAHGDAGLLRRIASELGADVPAQVAPGRWLASGAGEALEPLPAPAWPFGVLVLPAAVSLSTAAVYAEADRLGIGCGGEQLVSRAGQLREALSGGAQFPPEELLHNDLQ